jgi:hypothetical protein
MDHFQLKKRGRATAADGVYMQAGYFDDVMKKCITNMTGKARSDGFAPGDMLVNKFNGCDGVGATEVLPTISKTHPLSDDSTIDVNCTLNTRDYVFPHKSYAEAINIMRRCGIVRNVPGDDSCDYHCMMLLMLRMKLIDGTLRVTQFCHEIHECIESNMIKFVGDCRDGNDAVFQYAWGQMD